MRTIAWMWTAAAAIAVPSLWITSTMAIRAAARKDAELDNLRTVTDQAGQVRLLRATTPALLAVRPSTEGLTPRLSAAMASCGIPAGSLSSLSPQAETAVAGAAGVRLVRRHTALTLSPITLPQVGAFLATWRDREPAWTVTAVELTPEALVTGSARGSIGTGTDMALRAAITLEEISFQTTGGAH
jgi:hypothetical protein